MRSLLHLSSYQVSFWEAAVFFWILSSCSLKVTHASRYRRNYSVSYTHSLFQRRHIRSARSLPLHDDNGSTGSPITVETVFERCLKGWRHDNLGFPWFIPPPLLVNPGDAATGVGLVVTRIPPLALQEGIVDYSQKVMVVNGQEQIVEKEILYRVLNPGWLTFPLAKHEGRVRVFQTEATETGQDGCLCLEWNVQWTPLPVPILNSQWEDLMELTLTSLVSCACDYIAAIGQNVPHLESTRRRDMRPVACRTRQHFLAARK